MVRCCISHICAHVFHYQIRPTCGTEKGPNFCDKTASFDLDELQVEKLTYRLEFGVSIHFVFLNNIANSPQACVRMDKLNEQHTIRFFLVGPS